MNEDQYLWWYELTLGAIEYTIEDREYTYMLHWETAIGGWSNGLRDNGNSSNEDKARED